MVVVISTANSHFPLRYAYFFPSLPQNQNRAGPPSPFHSSNMPSWVHLGCRPDIYHGCWLVFFGRWLMPRGTTPLSLNQPHRIIRPWALNLLLCSLFWPFPFLEFTPLHNRSPVIIGPFASLWVGPQAQGGGYPIFVLLRRCPGVTNAGPAQWPFTCALHTYLSVSDVTRTAVVGLGGAPTLPK